LHGIVVATPGPEGVLEPEAADAVLSGAGGPPVGVVTADCLPILLASVDGRRVGAIHAGWRGLAAGVIGEALAVWADLWGGPDGVAAVIGPHAGPCCYEVDAPVRDAFDPAPVDVRDAAFTASRPGHWMLDLSILAREALRRAGLVHDEVAATAGTCTICDADRFESFRRDGAAAGRLVHAIGPRSEREGPGNDLA